MGGSGPYPFAATNHKPSCTSAHPLLSFRHSLIKARFPRLVTATGGLWTVAALPRPSQPYRLLDDSRLLSSRQFCHAKFILTSCKRSPLHLGGSRTREPTRSRDFGGPLHDKSLPPSHARPFVRVPAACGLRLRGSDRRRRCGAPARRGTGDRARRRTGQRRRHRDAGERRVSRRRSRSPRSTVRRWWIVRDATNC